MSLGTSHNPMQKNEEVITSVEELLESYRVFGVNLSLERIHNLLARLGNPHQRVPMIHVAGTNGKGSVCAYLSAILTQAGYKTGCYTSPHLVSWCERFAIDGVAIAPQKLRSLIQQVIQAIEPGNPQLQPTVFEIVTAAAWLYFAQAQVDVAIMEVGLGGRLDATNVCDRPLVSVITSLSRDHWQQLGPTLAHIAAEKAAILRPLRPAVIGPLPHEAALIVRQQVLDLQCPAQWIEPAIPNDRPGWAQWEALHYPLPLLGSVQLINSAIALGVIKSLREQGWEISEVAVIDGMHSARWPGRLQWLELQGQMLLVDGAHNAASAHALRDYLDSLPSQPTQWFIGMMATKDHAEVLKILLRAGDRVTCVPIPNKAGEPPENLQAIVEGLEIQLSSCCGEDVWTALETTNSDAYRSVLCGSLYLLGDFFKQAQIPVSGSTNNALRIRA